eukprot:136085_1
MRHYNFQNYLKLFAMTTTFGPYAIAKDYFWDKKNVASWQYWTLNNWKIYPSVVSLCMFVMMQPVEQLKSCCILGSIPLFRQVYKNGFKQTFLKENVRENWRIYPMITCMCLWSLTKLKPNLNNFRLLSLLHLRQAPRHANIVDKK